jgi:putative phage-type endonuclease
MKIVNLAQGTPEWKTHRAKYFNASDAPAMMGVSPYETRSDLISRLATGEMPEVSSFTQSIFDKGHAAEALARPIAETIIGEDLYPMTGVSECSMYSASFDGLTMDERVAWEHKSWNASFESTEGFSEVSLPENYLVQMEHQLMVSGAQYVLFSATKWQDGDCLRQGHTKYLPNADRRAAIIAGWAQLKKDIEAYVPTLTAPPVVAEAIEALPTLWAKTSGSLSVEHNMGAFKERLDGYLAGIKTTLKTDQDFADANENAKACGEIEGKLTLAADQLIAQNASVAEVVDFARSQAAIVRQMRLKLEKLVTSEKEARKHDLLKATTLAYDKHLAAIEKELEGLCNRPMSVRQQAPDWRGAAANKRTIASMQASLDTALAQGKIALDAAAKIVRTNVAHLKVTAPEHDFLFSDLQQIAGKPAEDFANLVAQRVAQHKDKIEREAQEAIARRDAQAKAQAERAAREAQIVPVASMPTVVIPAETAQPTHDEQLPQPTQTKPTVTLCELKFEQWLNIEKIRATEDHWLTWQAAWNAKP